ncbi:hypothetical protein DQ238_00325 [Geodermatophilus sp. TF02-6]|uniref:hypothetical protein n=1 Tax=Geodermatophilus sp. TF02-6 TaxID=2250575 RepID=UPI000DE97E88|nr:hypothetical protein [Geodermatophilus sp. TF02-6]RBY83580.1 hypothetical protein DQ238_00325 [Geodermatophilus sp. TF02-6]
MTAALRLWWLFARRQGPDRLTTGLAVLAFTVATWVLLTVLGGVRAFLLRSDAAGSEDGGVYAVLAVTAAALVLVPVVTLGGAAARLAVARRHARLAALRLTGATTGQVASLAVADALAQAVAGALAGAALYGATLPLVALLHFQGRAFGVSELWLGAQGLAALPAGPLVALVSVLGRRVVRAARTVPTLLAGRRMLADPKSVWRSVGGVALVAFVAGVLCVSPGMAAAGEGAGQLGTDIATGTTVTLVIASLLAAVSTGVTQAARVLDQAAEYRSLHLAGTEVGVLHAARLRETWIPLGACVGGASLAALLLITLFVQVLLRAPSGTVLFLGSVGAGCSLVVGGTVASRRLVDQAARSPGAV